MRFSQRARAMLQAIAIVLSVALPVISAVTPADVQTLPWRM